MDTKQGEEQLNSKADDDGKGEEWILPPGAEVIIRQIAAELILHQLLDHCCDVSKKPFGGNKNRIEHHNDVSNQRDNLILDDESSMLVDFEAIECIAREFPGACCRTYDFRIDTRDDKNRVRQLLPLAILCCLDPPISVVRAVYEAYPQAIATLDPAKGATPLLYACSFEASFEVCDFLIQQFPRAVELPRKDGATPLAMACSYRASPLVLDLLLSRYPNGIKVTSVDGWYPLHAAVACEAPFEAIQKLYRAYPQSITDTNNSTQSTALHLACSRRASFDVVKFLLEVSPDSARTEDSKRMTPWFWAVYTQTLSVIELFVKYFPDEDELPILSPDGIYLLHFAARQNSSDVVEWLTHRYPFMVMARTRYRGMTPLHTACQRNRPLDVVKCLVEKNPRCLFVRNQRGRFPIDEARDARASKSLLQYLEKEQKTRKAWWW